MFNSYVSHHRYQSLNLSGAPHPGGAFPNMASVPRFVGTAVCRADGSGMQYPDAPWNVYPPVSSNMAGNGKSLW